MITKFNFNRKGTFTVSREIIMDDPEAMMKALNDVLIIKAENCFITDSIIYSGYSEHFDEVGQGSTIPEYQCIITSTHNHFSVDWKRKNDMESIS